MGALINVFLVGIPAIISGMLAFITRKTMVAAASIASFVLLLGVFVACINTILQSILSLTVVPTWISNAMGLFIPFNFGLVLSAIISSKICGAAYRLAMVKIKAIYGSV